MAVVKYAALSSQVLETGELFKELVSIRPSVIADRADDKYTCFVFTARKHIGLDTKLMNRNFREIFLYIIFVLRRANVAYCRRYAPEYFNPILICEPLICL